MVESDVSIRKLVKRYGDTVAVDGVDLEVPRGAFVTFLGPSGCGKTTTLRLIGGFEQPDSGEIHITGQPMGNRPPHRRHTSMVFQNYALFPHMSVADNIGYGLRERKVARQHIRRRVEEMLELVQLQDLGARMPLQLSGGQQQRVALARSLVIEPTVLLLDEPLGALDLKLRRQMQTELKRIQRQVGITFIYVTHDQEEALTMSDRIVVMNGGRVEQEGSAEEIFDRPKTRFVAEFMGGRNLLDVEIVDRDALSTRVRVGAREMTIPGVVPQGSRTATMVVRPEKVRVGTLEGWPGRIQERVYKGATTSYSLRLTDGIEIDADVTHDDPALHHAIGDDVCVGFRPQDAVLIFDRP